MNIPTSKSRQKSIGANGVLRFCNLIVACLIFSGFFREELVGHPYVDRLTLLLGLVLCLQTYVVLRLEMRNRDPFVLIMTYLLTFFYSLRIFTLLCYPVQEVFLRYAYGPSDSNHALVYILLANVCIYIGFYRVKLRDAVEIDTVGYEPKAPRLGVLLFVLSLVFGLFVQKSVPENVGRFVNLIYNNFLTPNAVLLVLAAYVIAFRKRLPAIYIKIVAVGGITLAVLQTLAFSRSALLTFFDNLLIVVLALLPAIRLPRKLVVTAFVLLPFLLAAAFSLYAISTATRGEKADRGETLTEKVALARESVASLKDDPRIDVYLAQGFARAGYFDYSAEIIAHRDRYAGVFTARNYFKSIVDNMLTPGFDFFDYPRIASALKYAYRDAGDPSRTNDMEAGAGHSDYLGLYGEMYALFGYASFLVLPFCSYCLKRAFKRGLVSNPFLIALKRILLVLIFFRWMNSYGLDWVLWDFVTTLIIFVVLFPLFGRKVGRLHKEQSVLVGAQVTDNP